MVSTLESWSPRFWGCYLEVIPSSFLLMGKNTAQSFQTFEQLGGLGTSLYLELEYLVQVQILHFLDVCLLASNFTFLTLTICIY